MTPSKNRPWRVLRMVLIGGCGLAAAPAAAADAQLVQWARQEAAPQLLMTLEAAEGGGDRHLAHILRASLETDGAAQFPVHDAKFWQAAVESRAATRAALAVRLVALAADGDAEAIAAYRDLLSTGDAPAGVVSWVLTGLFERLPAESGATLDPLVVGDRALDRGDFALAAVAYRLVLLDASPEDYAYRDIAGHYFYCLDALRAAPDLDSARTRFNRTVVFPSVQAQSQARTADASREHDPDARVLPSTASAE